jgi:hypothetical protein
VAAHRPPTRRPLTTAALGPLLAEAAAHPFTALASWAMSDRLCRKSPPAQAPAALPCRLADLAVLVCSYPIAERAELTIMVEGGASAGYGASGIEFGD